MLLPAVAFAQYKLTPIAITEEAVTQKLTDLGYMEPSNGDQNDAKLLFEAIQAFQEDQQLESTDEMDTRTLVRLFSEADSSPESVWVPVYGGKRYHSHEFCSNMNEPEYVSIDTATQLGYTPCKRCW
jgi:hypothetical protein